MTTTRKATTTAALRKRATRAIRCTHPDQFIVYPGEITIDKDGLMREDDMRLDCPDCHRVVTYDGP